MHDMIHITLFVYNITIPFSSMFLSYLRLSLYLSMSDTYGNTTDPQPTLIRASKIHGPGRPVSSRGTPEYLPH